MLAQMLASVQGQLYGNWELCIADDCSSEPHVADMLRAAAAADSRIKLHLSPENRGVAHASNRALDLAGGEFVVLLDHDDLLEPQALFRVAQALIAEGPDMIYSDEIMLSADLKKVLQYAFRPAFSPEFLRSHPYIVHMVGFRAGLLREIGGFDETLAISQDYDLILRAAERADVVTHIPGDSLPVAHPRQFVRNAEDGGRHGDLEGHSGAAPGTRRRSRASGRRCALQSFRRSLPAARRAARRHRHSHQEPWRSGQAVRGQHPRHGRFGCLRHRCDRPRVGRSRDHGLPGLDRWRGDGRCVTAGRSTSQPSTTGRSSG